MKINRLSLVIPAALILSGCTLFPVAGPISGTTEQKALKLAEIIKNGGTANCKITNIADNSSTEIFVNGKKMKFVGTDTGQGKKGMMINDGEFIYTWSDGDKTGVKLSAAVPTGTPTGAPVDTDTDKQAAMYDDESKYKMDCKAGVVIATEFTPPVDVKFTDLSEMMKAVPSIPKGMPSLPAGY